MSGLDLLARPIWKNSNRLRDPLWGGPDGRRRRSSPHEDFRKRFASSQAGHGLPQHRRTSRGQRVDGEKSCSLGTARWNPNRQVPPIQSRNTRTTSDVTITP